MNWKFLVANYALALFIGGALKGGVKDWYWWLLVGVFWILMSFRDYFLKRGF